jgi:hypothetical protein
MPDQREGDTIVVKPKRFLFKKFKAGVVSFSKLCVQPFKDMVGISGAVVISYGAWLFSQPLGFIVLGAFLMAGAALASYGPKVNK